MFSCSNKQLCTSLLVNVPFFNRSTQSCHGCRSDLMLVRPLQQPFKWIVHQQTLQNAAARVVTDSRKRNYMKPILRELHWLPVVDRIQHKVLSTNHFRDLFRSTCWNSFLHNMLTHRFRLVTKSLPVLPNPTTSNTKQYGGRASGCHICLLCGTILQT